jgi:hypothetical protein
MIAFRELREKTKTKLKGSPVSSGRTKRIAWEISKDSRGYHAYIDGDYLDKFRSERDAKKSIDTAIKELT